MQYITLEHIDQYLARKAQHKKHFFWNVFREVFQFGAIFLTVFLLSTIIVNANLFYHTMKSVFAPARADDAGATLAALSAPVMNNAAEDQSQYLEQQVRDSMKSTSAVLPSHTETMSHYLAAKMKNQGFQLDLIPWHYRYKAGILC